MGLRLAQIRRSNEIELFLKENTAKEYNLKSATDVDSTLLINISNFSPVSTEAVIFRYLQNPKSNRKLY